MRKNLNPLLRVEWMFALSKYKRQQTECLKILHGFAENVVLQRIETRKNKNYKENDVSEEVIGKSE